MRVFLSHTADLERCPGGRSFVAAAKAAVTRAGHSVVDMAEFPAHPGSPADLCRARVAGSDVYLGILGPRYGSTVAGLLGVSFTELEFATAALLDRPRLVFVLDPSSPAWADLQAGGEDDGLQDAFRQRVLGSGVTVKVFDSPARLELEVFHALVALENQNHRGTAPPTGGYATAPTSAYHTAAPAGSRLTPAHPASLPVSKQIPRRLATFTGREALLDRIDTQLNARRRVAVTALHGLGGIGKTQLALEYAHRHADQYTLMWWIEAEQPVSMVAQLAALGARLGLPGTGTVTDDAAATVALLGQQPGWLLIFDNADAAEAVQPWLPAGTGHILITSRSPVWGGVADSVGVDLLPADEAVALIRARLPTVDPGDARLLAEELGCLPLALAQAAAYMEATGVLPRAYLDRFRTRRMSMLSKGRDLAYGGTIDTAWTLALDRLGAQPHAEPCIQLLTLAAFLGPDPIPLRLFTDHPGLLPAALARVTADGDPDRDLDDVVAAVLAYSLARRDGDTIQVHRLVQAVIRSHLDGEQQATAAARTRDLLAATLTGQPEHPDSWPAWAEFVPHLLAAPALHPDNRHSDIGTRGRQLLFATGSYLTARGDYAGAHALDARTHDTCKRLLGDDHPETLIAATNLATDLSDLHDYHAARALDEDALARRRRLLGDDHPDTLTSASNLAVDLHDVGDLAAARALFDDTLTRRRRVLGSDHPDTLTTAQGLAAAVRESDVHAARVFDEDTLARCRRVLGHDHPRTLTVANSLACDLRDLGDYQAARVLDEDTLTRCRRVLGEDHPDTMLVAGNLAIDLTKLGEYQAARPLAEETLARQRRVLGDGHHETRRCAANLTQLLRALGQDAEEYAHLLH